MGFSDLLQFTRAELNHRGRCTLDQDAVRRIIRTPTYRLTRESANRLAGSLTDRNRRWLFSSETFVHPQTFQHHVFLIGARSTAEWVTAQQELKRKIEQEWGGQAMTVVISHPH
jgi:hypothetical protein